MAIAQYLQDIIYFISQVLLCVWSVLIEHSMESAEAGGFFFILLYAH
jgi:hypothetical protein